MGDPINYGAAFQNIPNPFDSFAKGMELGNAVQAPFIARQQAQAQADQQAQIEEARKRVLTGDATAEDRVNYLSLVAPEQAKVMQDAFNNMDKTLVQKRLKDNLEVISAIDSGAIDIAKQRLEDDAVAYENSGTPVGKQQAAYVRNFLMKRLEESPEAVKSHLLDTVAFSPDGKTAIDAYVSNKKMPSEIRLLDAQAEAMARENRGMLKPAQVVETENKLHEQYMKETAKFQALRGSYGDMLNAQETGAGDLAIIFAYMKMLDPTSVVREGEQDSARKTAGIPDQLWSTYLQVKEGRALAPVQREGFVNQAQALYENSKKDEDIVRKGVERIANNRGLNLENIFYQDKVIDPTGPASSKSGPAPKGVVDTKNRTVTIPSGEILKYGTQAEFDAAIKAMRAKGLID